MYFHTSCRLDTHLSIREKHRNREFPARVTKPFPNYFSEHSKIISFKYPNSCSPRLCREQTTKVPRQAACHEVHGRLEYLFRQGGPVEHKMKNLSFLWELERDKVDAKSTGIPAPNNPMVN